MDMSGIILKMLLLMLTIAIGYAANKMGYMDKDFSSKLAKFLLDVTVPAVLLSAGMSGDINFTPVEALKLVLIAVAIFIITAAVAFAVPALIHAQEDEKGTYRVLAAFSNTIFMGYPVAAAFYGSSAIIYPAIFAIPFNIAIFCVGPAMLGGKTESDGWKKILNTGTIFSVLALIIIVLPFEMPTVVRDLCSSVGSATSPLALMIIGSDLAEMPLKKIFATPRMYIFSVFRLVVQPVVCFLILSLFVKDPVVLGCAIIIAGLPSASTATLLAAKYGGHEELASQGVMLTTLLSVVTIPAVMYILFR